MQIWKFPIAIEKKQIVKMPKDAVILCVQVQDDTPCIWAEVEPKAKGEERIFEMFGTGWDIPCDMGVQRKYIGTVQQGGYVWHYYERLN